MIRRVCIKCETCDYPITLRIAIMSNKHPCYTFKCPSCKIDIKFGLLSNRDYDKFLNMDMEKYLIIDKAQKNNCFKENDILDFLCEDFDAHIRNSSHHGGTRFDTNKNVIILEFGQKLKQEEMTIEEYIKHCILIFEEIIETNMILVFYNHGFELDNK